MQDPPTGAGALGASVPFIGRPSTPLRVSFDTLPRRAGALLVDNAVWLALILTALVMVGRTDYVVMNWSEDTGWVTGEEQMYELGVMEIWLVTWVWFSYLVAMEAFWDATLGKLLLGLRVVRESGERAGFRAAALRNVPRFAAVTVLSLVSMPWLVPGLFVVEWFLSERDPRGRRAGDRLAGTVVIRAGDVFALRVLTASTIAATAGAAPEPAAGLRAYAGFGRRFVALVADCLMLEAAFEALALTGLQTSVYFASQDRAGEPFDTGLSAAGWVGMLLPPLVRGLYFIGAESRGATVGKWGLGIRVTDPAGRPPGVRRAAMRYLIFGIGEVLTLALLIPLSLMASDDWVVLEEAFVVLMLGSGVVVVYSLFLLYDGLSMLWNERHQTIHDRMGGTFVVRAGER